MADPAADQALLPILKHYGGFDRPTLAGLRADLAGVFAIAGPAILTQVATPLGQAFVTRMVSGYGEAVDAPRWIGLSAAALSFLLVGAGVHITQTVGLALANDLVKEELIGIGEVRAEAFIHHVDQPRERHVFISLLA